MWIFLFELVQFDKLIGVQYITRQLARGGSRLTCTRKADIDNNPHNILIIGPATHNSVNRSGLLPCNNYIILKDIYIYYSNAYVSITITNSPTGQ